mgnify:CR=1 FL=1
MRAALSRTGIPLRTMSRATARPAAAAVSTQCNRANALVSSTRRSLSVKIDKSPGQKGKLTGYWTSRLPQELVAAMSRGDGDGDIRTMMREAAEEGKAAAAAAAAAVDGDVDDAAKRDAVKAASRDLDR